MKYKDLDIQGINTYLSKYGFTEEEIKEVMSFPSTEEKTKKIEFKKYIDIEDIEPIRVLYEQYTVPFYRIKYFYNLSEYRIRNLAIKNNIQSRGKLTGRNSYNNFFETIDTPEKAYYLGLWFADGSVFIKDNTYTSSLTLTQTDDYIIQTFLHYSGVKGTIYITHKEDKHPRSQLNISSKKMCEDLIKLGCIPDKSHKELTIPTIDGGLEKDFIRGFYDGDGICYKDGRIGFCGNKEMLEYIYNIFNKKVFQKDCKTHISYNKSNGIYYLTYSKPEEIKQIVNFIYKDKKDLYLIRKFDQYRPLIE